MHYKGHMVLCWEHEVWSQLLMGLNPGPTTTYWLWPSLNFLISVWLSCGCHNTLPQTEWCRTTEFYYLTFYGDQNSKNRYEKKINKKKKSIIGLKNQSVDQAVHLPSEAFREKLFLASSGLWRLPAFLGLLAASLQPLPPWSHCLLCFCLWSQISPCLRIRDICDCMQVPSWYFKINFPSQNPSFRDPVLISGTIYMFQGLGPILLRGQFSVSTISLRMRMTIRVPTMNM